MTDAEIVRGFARYLAGAPHTPQAITRAVQQMRRVIRYDLLRKLILDRTSRDARHSWFRIAGAQDTIDCASDTRKQFPDDHVQLSGNEKVYELFVVQEEASRLMWCAFLERFPPGERSIELARRFRQSYLIAQDAKRSAMRWLETANWPGTTLIPWRNIEAFSLVFTEAFRQVWLTRGEYYLWCVDHEIKKLREAAGEAYYKIETERALRTATFTIRRELMRRR
jgi:hypothetical protein